MKFDAYEYIGVAIPGAIPTLAAALLFPKAQALFGSEGVQLGGLGLFIVTCFIVGHVVQAVGSMLDWIEEQFGFGIKQMPFSKGHGGVSAKQWERFERVCQNKLGSQIEFSKDTWRGIRKEIFANFNDSTTQRIEIFNRNYGLCRGISTAFLITTILVILTTGVAKHREIVVILLFLATLMYFRKRHFSKLYFQELVAQFLVFEAKNLKQTKEA